MEEKIKNFIEKKHIYSIYIDMHPISDIKELFGKYGYVKGEMDTNGWQVDFVIPFISSEEIIELSGSWYYGEYMLNRVIQEI